MLESDIGPSMAHAAPSARARMPWTILVLFLAIHVILGVDRAILSVVAEPLKLEFGLTDTQLGILAGIGFSAFYSVAGIVLGWAVDRYNRGALLSACVAIFGAATASAAWAGSFAHLLMSRLLVGAGEAGGGPSMVSMIADLVPLRRRGLAMSIFYAGAPLGLLFTFLIGGIVASRFGWRATFLVAGLPAIALALLAAIIVRDPGRQITGTKGAMGFQEALRHIFSQPAALKILLSCIFYAAPLTAMIAFMASFLIRIHHLDLAHASLILAAALGLAGTIGVPVSGQIADILARRDIRWRSWWCAVSLTLSLILAVAAVVAPSAGTAIALLVAWGFISNAVSGPAMATYQSVLTERARGLGASLYYLCGQLIGSAGGAFLAGFVSDTLAPDMGTVSIRYGLLAVLMFQLVAVVLWIWSATTVSADMDRAADLDRLKAS